MTSGDLLTAKGKIPHEPLGTHAPRPTQPREPPSRQRGPAEARSGLTGAAQPLAASRATARARATHGAPAGPLGSAVPPGAALQPLSGKSPAASPRLPRTSRTRYRPAASAAAPQPPAGETVGGKSASGRQLRAAAAKEQNAPHAPSRAPPRTSPGRALDPTARPRRRGTDQLGDAGRGLRRAAGGTEEPQPGAGSGGRADGSLPGTKRRRARPRLNVPGLNVPPSLLGRGVSAGRASRAGAKLRVLIVFKYIFKVRLYERDHNAQ